MKKKKFLFIKNKRDGPHLCLTKQKYIRILPEDLFQYHTDNLYLYLWRKSIQKTEKRITVYVIDIFR